MKLKSLFFTSRFFWTLLAISGLFVLSFMFKPLYPFVKIVPALFALVVILEILLLYQKKARIAISRQYPQKLSNGDENELRIIIQSFYSFDVKAKVLEELPIQFQYRDFHYHLNLKSRTPETIVYALRPIERGVYRFGICHVLVTRFGFVQRKFQLRNPSEHACYPSFIQLRKYSLLATTNRLTEAGIKRIRKIGSTMEFEMIKEYVPGDDYRFINWKATAKTKKVMVNQYEDEKSQPIYSFIDLGRNMRMPFNQLTLLDYAINASLVLSNIAIMKQDRAGILSFSKKIDKHIPASKRNHQMQLISDGLYHIHTDFSESEFGNLYTYARNNINQRSLIFLYTNFETMDAMTRQLDYLRLLNKSHIVVVVIFKNTELQQLANTTASGTRRIYNQIIAEKLVYEKQLIVQKIQQAGIQAILTEPENLTVNSINKYLEIKARGLI